MIEVDAEVRLCGQLMFPRPKVNTEYILSAFRVAVETLCHIV